MVGRIFFLAYHFERTKSYDAGLVLQTFLHAVPLDISTTCYLLLIPFVFIQLDHFRNTDSSSKIRNFNFLFIVLVSGICVIDMELFRNWGIKLNSYALSYLMYPKEAYASMASSPLLLLFILFIVLCAAGVFLLLFINRWNVPDELNLVKPIWRWTVTIGSLFITSFLLIIGIRGGLTLLPINQSSSYFSKYPFINAAATNSEWHLIHSFTEIGVKRTNNYMFMPDDEAQKLVKLVYTPKKEQTKKILDTSRPNVLLIVLESFTADIIFKLGGEKGVCPNFEKLIKEGYLFNHIYSSGDRTDKGLVSIISGFPSQPKTSIITQPEKFDKLPSMARVLRDSGYQNTFIYGGESGFANMKSYLLSSGYDFIIDKNDFLEKDMNSKWGAHDGVMFSKAFDIVNRQTPPFFTTLLTLSSHEPFEVPNHMVYWGEDEPSRFKNAAHYTDSCLFDFINKVKETNWYDSTLIILVADHGHRLPKNTYSTGDPGRYRIPLLIMGGALNRRYKGKLNTVIANQTDIATTLLKQLGMDHSQFLWGRDMMNLTYKSFSYYSFENGFGWVSDRNQIIYDCNSQTVTHMKNPSDTSELKYGKAYLQKLIDSYLAY